MTKKEIPYVVTLAKPRITKSWNHRFVASKSKIVDLNIGFVTPYAEYGRKINGIAKLKSVLYFYYVNP